MSSKKLMISAILEAMSHFARICVREVSSNQLSEEVKASPATIKRHLDALVKAGVLIRKGNARSTRYLLPDTQIEGITAGHGAILQSKYPFPMSPQSLNLLDKLRQPLSTRKPVSYQSKFIEDYVPNESFLLPEDLAESLFKEGRLKHQLPAGTYARKVFEQLLIDLSWSSSRLEGNRFTLLATEELFKGGMEGSDSDAVMLLNHKRAIEFLVETVPEYGLTNFLIRNLQSLLMQDLLNDSNGLGEIRTKIVNISDTVYLPCQVPTQLREMLDLIIDRARKIRNPIESAFFLWINIAYLQPFEDGNKRTSRLAANIPLIIYNCAPLSFLDIDIHHYALAMIGVYELLDSSLAADLFAWTYRRSIQKYATVLQSLGGPDPFRIKYREQLSIAVQMIVRDGQTMDGSIDELQLPATDKMGFEDLLREELASLTEYNCARYRVTGKMVKEWETKGRPY